MGKKKAGLYAALVWLARNPESTAYEVANGIGFADAWRVFEWLARAEAEGMVRGYRKGNCLAIYWKAVTGKVPDGPVVRSSLGNDATEPD